MRVLLLLPWGSRAGHSVVCVLCMGCAVALLWFLGFLGWQFPGSCVLLVACPRPQPAWCCCVSDAAVSSQDFTRAPCELLPLLGPLLLWSPVAAGTAALGCILGSVPINLSFFSQGQTPLMLFLCLLSVLRFM